MAKAVRKEAAGYSPSAAARFVRTCTSAMLAHGEIVGRFNAERASLVQFLREKGLILPGNCCADFRPVSEGAEHVVYHDEGNKRAIKVTRENTYGHSIRRHAGRTHPLAGTPLEYLQRLAYHNLFFGDDIRLLGGIITDDCIGLVTSQPWILSDEAPLATEAQITDYFAELGFVRVNLYPDGNFYYFLRANIAAADASASNMVFSNSGELIPIDVVIGTPDEEHKILIWRAQNWIP